MLNDPLLLRIVQLLDAQNQNLIAILQELRIQNVRGIHVVNLNSDQITARDVLGGNETKQDDIHSEGNLSKTIGQ